MIEVISKLIEYKTGLKGSVLHSGTSVRKGFFQGFICQDDCVVSVIVDFAGNDVTDELGLRGKTIKPGMYIGLPKGRAIYSIILASGSIVLYSGVDLYPVPGVSDQVNAFISRATLDGATIESSSCITSVLTTLNSI